MSVMGQRLPRRSPLLVSALLAKAAAKVADRASALGQMETRAVQHLAQTERPLPGGRG